MISFWQDEQTASPGAKWWHSARLHRGLNLLLVAQFGLPLHFSPTPWSDHQLNLEALFWRNYASSLFILKLSTFNLNLPVQRWCWGRVRSELVAALVLDYYCKPSQASGSSFRYLLLSSFFVVILQAYARREISLQLGMAWSDGYSCRRCK